MKCFEMLQTVNDQKDLDETISCIAVDEEFVTWLPGYDIFFGAAWDPKVPELYRHLLGEVLNATVAYKALETPLTFPKWVRDHLMNLVQKAHVPLENLDLDLVKVQAFQEFVDALVEKAKLGIPHDFSDLEVSPVPMSHDQWRTLLSEVELELPERIRSGDFRSMHVTYAKPYVERLFFQRGEHRVFLHRIEGCLPEEALWHSHPWPSVIKVLDTEGGIYRHTVGAKDHVSSVQTSVASFAAPIVYTMLEPEGFHSVCTDKASWSVMITGPRWSPPEASKFQSPLSSERVQELLSRWQEFYPQRIRP